MSLLMDALKQAEHAKRDAGQDTQTPSSQTAIDSIVVAEPGVPDTELSLSPVEPVPANTESDVEEFDATVMPDIQETVSAEPVVEAVAAAPVPSAEPSISDSVLVQTAVETPVEPTSATTPLSFKPPCADNSSQAAERILAASEARMAMQRRRSIYAMAGLAVMMLIAMAGYYYWAALSHLEPQMRVPHLPETLTFDTAQGGPLIAEDPTPPALHFRRTETAIQPPDSAGQTAAPVEIRSPDNKQPSPPPAEPLVAAEQAASPQAVIRISRGSRNDRVSVTLQTAYLDYQAGRHTQAAEGYRQVLTVEPANRDARLGLAALAIHRGETETARTLYRELLRRDPGDAAAHAALAGLQDETSAATESELKNLLAEQPQSAQLHFALANLYARQVRWPLAQQAYFEAQRLAPQHPDYAFNLAVSLEHLGQSRPALEYYRRALSLATRRPAGFDIAAAEQRARALARQAQP